jgi:hypothetical protein
MTRLSILVPLALLSGCIIYDTRAGKCPGCEKDDGRDTGDDDRDDTGGPTDTGGATDTDTPTDTGAEAPENAFTLTPNVADIGTTFIASLTTDVGFDYGTVQGVELYGDAEVLATDARADELLLTISVPADAAPGSVDLLLLLPDDRVSFVADALTLVVAGSDDPSETEGGSGTDDGSGTDGSGTGTDDSGSCP